MSKTQINIARLRLQLAKSPRPSPEVIKSLILNQNVAILLRAREKLRRIVENIQNRAASCQNLEQETPESVEMLTPETVMSEPEQENRVKLEGTFKLLKFY
jgi:hypothetical protein